MSHYTNRYNFWNDNKQTIVLIDPKYSSYREFEGSYFKNETNFYIFFNLMRDRFNFGQDLKTLYSIFACDLEWAKKTVFCGGTSSATNNTNNTNNTSTTNMFACLLKDTDLKLQQDVVVYTNPDNKNDKWYFYTNYRYFQTKTALKGTWSCVGSDSYTIKLDNGQVYDPKTDTWTQKTNNTNTNTTVNTNLTGNDLTSGSTVKVGMRGDIVTKIQELLIAKGFIHVSKNDTADGIFGNRTKRMVAAFQAANGLEDDGIVGKDTWAKLSDGAAATNSSTNQTTNTKDPFEVPGSDSSIMQESRKKILRKYLQEFK